MGRFKSAELRLSLIWGVGAGIPPGESKGLGEDTGLSRGKNRERQGCRIIFHYIVRDEVTVLDLQENTYCISPLCVILKRIW